MYSSPRRTKQDIRIPARGAAGREQPLRQVQPEQAPARLVDRLPLVRVEGFLAGKGGEEEGLDELVVRNVLSDRDEAEEPVELAIHCDVQASLPLEINHRETLLLRCGRAASESAPSSSFLPSTLSGGRSRARASAERKPAGRRRAPGRARGHRGRARWSSWRLSPASACHLVGVLGRREPSGDAAAANVRY
jgi:hypothetical protein